MIDISKGRYWDLPWSLIDGCTPCSPGCERCWSAAMAHRFVGWPYTEGPHFNGYITTHPERLSIPLKRKKPTVYAVWNDLFHEGVDPVFRIAAYNTMVQCQQHTFLILTKRPQNINREWFRFWPGENIWHGLSVCNQQEADEKIPVFLQVPGKKFLSIEPMLSEINLHLLDDYDPIGGLRTASDMIAGIVLGGETGQRARPVHPDWVRSVRDECAAARVPFFLKYMNKNDGRVLDGREWNNLPWI